MDTDECADRRWMCLAGFTRVRYMMAFYSVAASFLVDVVVGEDRLPPTVANTSIFTVFPELEHGLCRFKTSRREMDFQLTVESFSFFPLTAH